MRAMCEQIAAFTSVSDVTAALQGRRFDMQSLPAYVLKVLDPDVKRTNELYAAVIEDPFFADVKTFDCPAAAMPTPPPKSAVVTESRNSGRKQSMMWKQNAVTALAQVPMAGGGGLSTLSLPQEGPDVVPLKCGPTDLPPEVEMDSSDAHLQDLLGAPSASTGPAGRGVGSELVQRRFNPHGRRQANAQDGGKQTSTAAYGASAQGVSQYFTVFPRGRGGR